jgi:hypothetical protein
MKSPDTLSKNLIKMLLEFIPLSNCLKLMNLNNKFYKIIKDIYNINKETFSVFLQMNNSGKNLYNFNLSLFGNDYFKEAFTLHLIHNIHQNGFYDINPENIFKNKREMIFKFLMSLDSIYTNKINLNLSQDCKLNNNDNDNKSNNNDINYICGQLKNISLNKINIKRFYILEFYQILDILKNNNIKYKKLSSLLSNRNFYEIVRNIKFENEEDLIELTELDLSQGNVQQEHLDFFSKFKLPDLKVLKLPSNFTNEGLTTLFHYQIIQN